MLQKNLYSYKPHILLPRNTKRINFKKRSLRQRHTLRLEIRWNAMNLILALFRPLFWIRKNKVSIHTLFQTHTHKYNAEETVICDSSSMTADVDKKCSFILRAKSLDDLQVENTRPASGCSPHQLAVCQACHPDTCMPAEVINSQMAFTLRIHRTIKQQHKTISYWSRTWLKVYSDEEYYQAE